MRPLLVVSPHLDDAVFSCAHSLIAHPGSVVVTVFAGAPIDGDRLTDWDRQCGYGNAAEAVAARRREDAAALAVLGAHPVPLDFCDSQYDATPAVAEVATALAAAIAHWRPARVLYPLGLFHSDHVLTHAACTMALQDAGMPSLAYEDALYRALPGLLQRRLAALAAHGTEATPTALHAGPTPDAPAARHARLAEGQAAPPGPNDGVAASSEHPAVRKRRAIACYVSQLKAFGADGYADTAEPERCWSLGRREDAPHAG